MISYEPLWETMKKCGVTTYTLINKHNINKRTIHRLKKNLGVNTHTLDILCQILCCSINDIIEIKPDRTNRHTLLINSNNTEVPDDTSATPPTSTYINTITTEGIEIMPNLTNAEIEKKIDDLLEEYQIPAYNDGYLYLKTLILYMYLNKNTPFNDIATMIAKQNNKSMSSFRYHIETVLKGTNLTLKKFALMCVNKLVSISEDI